METESSALANAAFPVISLMGLLQPAGPEPKVSVPQGLHFSGDVFHNQRAIATGQLLVPTRS